MITINLLPDDYKVEESTSPVKLLSIGASALISLAALVFFCVVHFYELPNTEDMLSQAKTKRESLRKFEQQHETLNAILKSFESRTNAVETVKAMRIKFSEKLHQLTKLMADGNHPVWLKSLTISQVAAAQQQPAGRVPGRPGTPAPASAPRYLWTAPSTCASQTLQSATAFYTAVRSDTSFFKEFVEITLPQYSQVSFPEIYEQKYGWDFTLEMTMQLQPAPKK